MKDFRADTSHAGLSWEKIELDQTRLSFATESQTELRLVEPSQN
jgi:hypothetical protein